MNRYGAVFWMILVLVAGFATFKAKYAIQDLEDELAKVRKQTVAEHQEIRVLTAEWTYLNQPERLADLNRHFLNLTPVGAKQLQQHIEDIPLRTPPAAAPAPETLDQLVAATAGDTPVQAAPEPAPTAAAAPVPVTVAAVTVAPVTIAAVAPTAIARAAAALAPIRVASAAVPTAAPIAAPVARPAARVQLAKASPSSLNALIAKIVEVR